MSNISQDFNCRNIGIIIKDYSNIIDSLGKKIGSKNSEKDVWGLPLGGIVNPYYAENDKSQWESNKYKSTTADYMEYIRKVFSDDPSFDMQYNLSNSELNINAGTLSTFEAGDSLSTILNGIQSFVTSDNNNGYGSAYSKLYSIHSNLDNGVGVVRNYNMNSPKKNFDGKSDTLMSNMALVYRGQMFMDGMLRWGTGGAFADYDRISSRMSQYDFTEANYGYGLNQNFGNAGMSQVGDTHIETIVGPLDIESNGLFAPDTLTAYKPYYKDLGWKSKSFYSTSMSYPLRGVKASALDPAIRKGDGNGNDELQDKVYFYPLNRDTSAKDSDTFVPTAQAIFDMYTKTYGTGYTRFEKYQMNRVIGHNSDGNSNMVDMRFEYAEAERPELSMINEEGAHTQRLERLLGDDEDQSACNNSDLETEEIVRENGQAYGKFVGYDLSSKMACKDLISHTNQAFVRGDYESLVARFHTAGADGRELQDTQTALSTQFGLSHGRNLLKKGASKSNPSYAQGYENPYCRVWTYHHQYHTLQNAIRGGVNQNAWSAGYTHGGVFGDSTEEMNRYTQTSVADYSFRATYSPTTSDLDEEGTDVDVNSETTLFMNGQQSLDDYSVLNHRNNLVNITPKDSSLVYDENGTYGGTFDIKRCMFSIENLAWRGNYNTASDSAFNTLSKNQIGPLGGRIMWFPPYGLDFSEDATAKWDSVGPFIGRGEDVKVYTNASRTGTLKFQLLVDHPSILNYLCKDDRLGDGSCDNLSDAVRTDSVDDTGSTEQTLLRFFAGCDILTPCAPHRVVVPSPDQTTPEDTGEKDTIPNPDDTTVTPPTNSDDSGTKQTEKEDHCIMFAVYFPNNYSAYFDGNDSNTDSSNSRSVGNPTQDELNFYPEPSRDNAIEQNLLYLVNGLGTQFYLNGFSEEDADTFYGLHATEANKGGYRRHYIDMFGNEFFAGNADGYDKDAYYYDSTISRLKFLPVSLDEDYTIVDSDNSIVVPYTEIDSSCKTLTSASTKMTYDKSSARGYEMGENASCGVSHTSEYWRFFSKVKDGENSALSSHTTPITMIVKDSNGQTYYMPSIWGMTMFNGSVDISMRNEWMYRTDTLPYLKPSTKTKRIHQQEFMYQNGRPYHADYNDSRSYGLNSAVGLPNVVKTTLKDFGFVYNEQQESGNTKYYTEDGKQLISFADFMFAMHLLQSGSEVNDDTDLDKYAQILHSDNKTIDVQNVKLVMKVFKDLSGVSVTVTGVSSNQGTSNKTSNQVLSDTFTDDNTSEDSITDANTMLAKHRSKSVQEYIKYMVTKLNKTSDINVSEGFTHKNYPCNDANVNGLDAKAGRCAIVSICYSIDVEKTEEAKDASSSTEGSTVVKEENNTNSYIESAESLEEEKEVSFEAPAMTRYDDEYRFFKTITREQPMLRDKIKEKVKYFDPAYHSISPEGFNSRLTFLHQCTRQGPTWDATNSNNASNLAFGRPPVCVLRLGDFIYSRVLIEGVSISYDEKLLWDLNPEGIGVQPMLASVQLKLVFLGGQDITGPISRLQNAVSFNYYANTRVYDDRSEQIEYDDEKKDPYTFNFVPNVYQ